jgi:hypothetical protein
MLDLMSSMDQVIIKRLPIREIIEQPVNDAGLPCECIDEIFHEANPDCRYCNGTGIIKAEMSSEWTERMSGEKKVWVTNAKIIHDDTAVIYDDEEEEAIVSDIHGFFRPEEDIQVDDYVIPSGGKISYKVTLVQTVRTPDNVLLKDCSLEPA